MEPKRVGKRWSSWPTFKPSSMKALTQSSFLGLKWSLTPSKSPTCSTLLSLCRKIRRKTSFYTYTESGKMEHFSLKYSFHEQACWPNAMNIYWRNFRSQDGIVREVLALSTLGTTYRVNSWDWLCPHKTEMVISLDYFLESQATEIFITNKVTLNPLIFFSGSLGLLLVIPVHFITCISEDSIWLHITGKITI